MEKASELVILGTVIDRGRGACIVKSSETGKLYHFILNTDQMDEKLLELSRNGKERYFGSKDGNQLDYVALDMGFTTEKEWINQQTQGGAL